MAILTWAHYSLPKQSADCNHYSSIKTVKFSLTSPKSSFFDGQDATDQCDQSGTKVAKNVQQAVFNLNVMVF